MALFKKKNDGYVDLSEKMRKRQVQAESFKSPENEVEKTPAQESSSGGFFGGFFGGGSASSTPVESSTEASEDKKRKLAKRLMDMTNKIESLESEVYQLKQKLEVLEKKQRLGY